MSTPTMLDEWLALGRARTAAPFRRPIRALADAFDNVRIASVTSSNVIGSKGALPVTLDGEVVGAIRMNMDAPDMTDRSHWTRSGTGGGRSVKILIIDGDPVNIGAFVDYFERQGFLITLASSLHGDVRDLATRGPDLTILDLHAGQANGLEMLRAIRSQSDVPLIVITGDRSDEVDCVLCLELGADDCLTQPIGRHEFVARIRAVLRRRLIVATARQGNKDHRRTRFGGWVLDQRLRTLTDPAGSLVGLTKGEYALLVAFVDSPQRPLSREHLLQATHLHEDVFDRSVDVMVSRLRRKLEKDPSAPRLITTERGIGYVFTLPVEHLG